MLSERRKRYENRPPDGSIGPNFAARAVRKPCLGGSLGALLAARGAVLKPLGLLLGLSRAAPGRSWGWFWDLPGADLDVLDDVCGAT